MLTAACVGTPGAPASSLPCSLPVGTGRTRQRIGRVHRRPGASARIAVVVRRVVQGHRQAQLGMPDRCGGTGLTGGFGLDADRQPGGRVALEDRGSVIQAGDVGTRDAARRALDRCVADGKPSVCPRHSPPRGTGMGRRDSRQKRSVRRAVRAPGPRSSRIASGPVDRAGRGNRPKHGRAEALATRKSPRGLLRWLAPTENAYHRHGLRRHGPSVTPTERFPGAVRRVHRRIVDSIHLSLAVPA